MWRVTMIRSALIRAALLSAIFLMCTMIAAAQEARLSGAVVDPTGAALVGADITATQTERNLVYQAKTGADGRYLFPRLSIGSYQVKAEAPGFRPFVQSDLTVTTS